MPTKIRRRSLEEDPLAYICAPPDGETEEQRHVRVILEKEAKQISDAIDEQLSREKAQEKKGPRPVKVLLLGQSESGKSTTLKNFQLMYDSKAFRAERASWRAIVQLNVVRSIHVILDVITRAQIRRPTTGEDVLPASPIVDDELATLKLRLSPLIRVEEILMQRLMPNGPDKSDAARLAQLTNIPYSELPRNVNREVAVHSANPWKDVFKRLVGNDTESFDSEKAIDWEDPSDPGVVLHALADDMKALWSNRTVQTLLDRQNLRLQEAAGFFLDCLDEVTSLKYMPSDDHILRARLKTLGVSEHRIKMTSGGMTGSISRDWRIYDVGGHRSLRAAWAPYFDDMHSIIFLCPISAFDQVLAEEPRLNRLADSVNLWTMIVSHKLLANTNIILFLNKIDIMKSKLESGIRLVDYVNSYGSRPNDLENASNYLRKKFAGIQREHSPSSRVFYCHMTTVTDRKSTQIILANIKDMLMHQYLEDASLIP
ncbi:guanine nucleotide binding protein, alpha subunit [Favolaschia claudopus]|uniref:Guanine nucleotide binding protein, alpha subunit n=1 Tax=Favolaschia claudopus TaxID=2862362 RepID=A0AAW0D2Y6_9AGAR